MGPVVLRARPFRWFLLIALAGDPPAFADAPVRSDPPVVITIVGTNDLHGRLEVLPVFGGALANLREARAQDGGGVLLVDAGDMFQGTIASNLGEGAAVVKAYNLLRYDAAAIGNHEFDFGPVGPAPSVRRRSDDPRGALKARAAEAKFPFLAANLFETASNAPPMWKNVRPTTIVTVAGVRVGLVGVTTIATPRTTLAANLRGLGVRALAPSIASAARSLRRQGAAIVVAVAHAGGGCRVVAWTLPGAPRPIDRPDVLEACEAGSEIFEVARALAAGPVDARVDAIVAGHTHDGIAHRVAGIPIIESYANGRAFGRIDLLVDRRSGALLESKIYPPHELGGLATYEGRPVVADAAIATAIAEARASAREKHEEQLGIQIQAPVLRAYRAESALGNLFADLMREAYPGADVAVTNGGGLRADLPAGPLTYGALFEAFPFDNTYAVIELSGAELGRMIARNLEQGAGILSISGVYARASCRGESLEVTLTRPDGTRVAGNERFTLVTSNFLATGGDALLAGGAPPRFDDRRLIRDAMADALRARQAPVDPGALYDPGRPRLSYPGKRPVRCAAPSSPTTRSPL